MRLILTLSDLLIPLLIFYITGFGVLSKIPVFEAFVRGAKEGVQAAKTIFPTLIGLLMGVGVLRASGFLEWLCSMLQILTDPLHIPAPLLPVIFVRAISNSAAVGLVLDIFKQYGADSQLGYAASILLGCTETIVYTMSVYFVSVKIKKTRYTLPGALIATAAGVIASLLLANWMFVPM